MDPQAAWDDLLEALAERDWDRVEDLAEGLLRWLRAGGFPPRAVTGNDLGSDWDREIALAGCRFALAQAREGMPGPTKIDRQRHPLFVLLLFHQRTGAEEWMAEK